jgi:catechol 2,3-dioxygenase-like lactoylglutathione lyase family enzyme
MMRASNIKNGRLLTMRIEHINLFVKDFASTLPFYQAAFPRCFIRAKGNKLWHGNETKWCHFGDDYNYLTFNEKAQGEARDLSSNQAGLAHIGFEVGDLKALETRMKNAGFHPSFSGPEHEYRRNTYFIDPSGIEVEFVQYLSDIPAHRNSN